MMLSHRLLVAGRMLAPQSKCSVPDSFENESLLICIIYIIIIFSGEIKSFVTHITENPPKHLVHIVFWSGIGQNVQKMAIFGPK